MHLHTLYAERIAILHQRHPRSLVDFLQSSMPDFKQHLLDDKLFTKLDKVYQEHEVKL